MNINYNDIMNNHYTVDYKNMPVIISKYKTGTPPKEHQRTCFCCNEKINDGLTVILMNSNKHIPNTYIHEKCFDPWSKKTETLCEDIESAYKQYQKLNDVFFGNK